jgi:hypothetical protein
MDLKTETKLIIHLSKKFDEDAENRPKKKIFSRDMVLMLEAKTAEAEKILSRFYSEDSTGMSEFDYTTTEPAICKFDTEYLTWVLKFFDMQDSTSVKLSVKKEYPLTVEDENFKFVLAPKVTDG